MEHVSREAGPTDSVVSVHTVRDFHQDDTTRYCAAWMDWPSQPPLAALAYESTA
jgi:hypothetical protein